MRKKLAFVAALISAGSVAGGAWAQGTPEPTTPTEPMQPPKQEAPKQEAPKQQEPTQAAPKQEAPTQAAPKQEAPKQETKLSASEQRFVDETFRDSLAEVELAKVVADKTTSPAVKKLAEMTETDHKKANESLKVIAEKRGITVPDSPTKDQKNLREKIEKTELTRFDARYVENTIAEHKKDIARFEKEIPNIKDPELKTWAEGTLDKLREHLKMAESVRDELSKPKPQQGEMKHEHP